jgi:hypothetical protein
MGALLEWMDQHRGLLTVASLASGIIFVGSLLAVPWLVARIPSDYFAHPEAPPAPFRSHHPAVRMVLLLAKNLLGIALLPLGLLMLFTPGQGLLTIFAALILIDGPGKRRLELLVVRQPPVRKALDWIRRRRGQPPLEIHNPERGGRAPG